jgi:hypothetical protein
VPLIGASFIARAVKIDDAPLLGSAARHAAATEVGIRS